MDTLCYEIIINGEIIETVFTVSDYMSMMFELMAQKIDVFTVKGCK